MAGICGGISVAFKQILPDQKVDLMVTELRVEVRMVGYTFHYCHVEEVPPLLRVHKIEGWIQIYL